MPFVAALYYYYYPSKQIYLEARIENPALRVEDIHIKPPIKFGLVDDELLRLKDKGIYYFVQSKPWLKAAAEISEGDKAVHIGIPEEELPDCKLHIPPTRFKTIYLNGVLVWEDGAWRIDGL
jgi:hypothetical protein